MTFLLINEYNYPVYRPPYGLEVHTTIKQLDLLENTLNSLNESDIFVLTHYPVDRAWLLKSSKGNSFEEIISNEKIYAIFSGHEHPSNVKIVHHGESQRLSEPPGTGEKSDFGMGINQPSDERCLIHKVVTVPDQLSKIGNSHRHFDHQPHSFPYIFSLFYSNHRRIV